MYSNLFFKCFSLDFISLLLTPINDFTLSTLSLVDTSLSCFLSGDFSFGCPLFLIFSTFFIDFFLVSVTSGDEATSIFSFASGLLSAFLEFILLFILLFIFSLFALTSFLALFMASTDFSSLNLQELQ